MDAMGEQRIFNSPDHVGIYPWTVMEAAKSNAHIHAQAVETKKNWIWDMRAICHCKHQSHNRTTWGTWASQTYLEGCSAPKILQQRDANTEVAPADPVGKLHRWIYKTSSNCQQHETDRGVHLDTTSFRLRTSNKPDRERQGRRRKTRAHKLIATKNSWAAI